MSDEPAIDLSVVLPAHNEISLLGSTVTTVVTALGERSAAVEIIIVENGSRDGTLRLSRLLSAQIPEVRVLTLPVANYGSALKAGFMAARGRLVVNFDVDYYDFAFLDAACSALNDDAIAIVVASKRAPGARDRRPWRRRVLTAAFTAILRSALDLQVSDAHGMKVLRREPLQAIVERCSMRGSLFDVEMVLRAGQVGFGVAEIPAVVVERRPPRSSIWKRSIESLIGVAVLRARLARERNGRTTLLSARTRRAGSTLRAISGRGVAALGARFRDARARK